MTLNLYDYIESIPDFPKKGINFRDITPLISDGIAYKVAIKQITEYAKAKNVNVIVGPESRGFLIGGPVANEMGIGMVPARKGGKLPRQVISEKYASEYGETSLELHIDSIKKGDKVMITDDLLATGGTIEATIKLIEKLGGTVVGLAFLIELKKLNGRDNLSKYDIFTLMEFDD